MGKELEVKVLNIDPKKMESKLILLGARLVKKEKQINYVFSTPNLPSSNYLRVREITDAFQEEKRSFLTLKKNLLNEGVKENLEIETKVDDPASLLEIFENLGIEVEHQGVKERTSYKFENILFEIDCWDTDTYPNPYMEIEVESKEDLERAIELLGLNRKDITTKSIRELRKDLSK